MQITITIPNATTLLRRGPLALPALLAVLAVTLVWPGAGPAMATGLNSVTSPDTAEVVGQWTSLALDASGNPVVSYSDVINGNVKVLHCGNPNCTAGNSITAPDPAPSAVGKYTSLALDASGNPVVSYYDLGWGDLRVLHCNDPNCSGGDESATSPDTGGLVGLYTSLALDSSGNPVVSYWNITNNSLKVLHCGNPNCTSGNSITAPDTGGQVGTHTSLALDASGYPVVSYFDDTNDDLKVLHCNDANCDGVGESITSPDTGGVGGVVGTYTSLALDASGYPVVSYFDDTNDDLKVLHCNDPNCDGVGESITSPDTDGGVGGCTSLALDAGGNPVVSYQDGTNGDLKVLHCDDANCSGDESGNMTAPDTGGIVGSDTSLALDASGNPVVSYHDQTNRDLKVLHCGKANCPVLAPQINMSKVASYQPPGSCYEVRDDLQNPLFTVCDNDFQGGPEENGACDDGTDIVCNDEDPAVGEVWVTVVPGDYRVVESKPPYNHTADPSNLSCNAYADGVKCEFTFVNTPNTMPWFPWDISGDGYVDLFNDILGVINHYQWSKP